MSAAIEIGARFGEWTVVSLPYRRTVPDRRDVVDCVCACGARTAVRLRYLLGGQSRRCTPCGRRRQRPGGRAKIHVEPGARFARWTVLHEDEPAPTDRWGNRARRVRCRCDCGTESTVLLHNLRTGLSLGCPHCREVHKTHGMSGSREHQTYCGMVARCTNERSPQWPCYGGRGIRVCDRWLGPGGFERFLADMGPRPRGRSLDRIDNDGPYSPENCRWATRRQQARNTRSSWRLPLDGREATLAEVAEIAGVSREAIRLRIGAGWPLDQLTLPRGVEPTHKRALGETVNIPTGVRPARGWTYGGVTRRLSEWAADAGLSVTTLAARIRLGWPEDWILTKPAQTPMMAGLREADRRLAAREAA